MPAASDAYDQEFFSELVGPAQRAAAVVVPLVASWVQPTSVLDVGCGLGDWLAEWVRGGVSDVQGVDGDYVDRSRLRIPAERFMAADLAQPLDLGRRFDLVSSLEVAEHLEERFAEQFVASLVRHGDVVLFSAAPPGQAGTHHVNCRWPSWWAERFAHHGYDAFDVIRPAVWQDERVVHWYRQNTLVFARGGHVQTLSDLASGTKHPLDVAHPAFLEAVLGAQSLRQQLRGVGTLAAAAARRRLGGRPA